MWNNQEGKKVKKLSNVNYIDLMNSCTSLVARVKVMLGGRHGRELGVARVCGARRRIHNARVLRLLFAELLLLHHGDVGRTVHLEQAGRFNWSV